jgi:Tfp pilus assembly protein PilN
MRKKLAGLAVSLVLTLFFTQHGLGQTSDELKSLKDEIKTLKEGQTAIQKDLQEIKNLLRTRQAQPQAPPPFKEAVVNIDAGHVKGDKNAKLVMIDFSEYQ